MSPLLPVASLGPFNGAIRRPPMRSGEVLFGRLLREWRRSVLELARRRAPPPAATR